MCSMKRNTAESTPDSCSPSNHYSITLQQAHKAPCVPVSCQVCSLGRVASRYVSMTTHQLTYAWGARGGNLDTPSWHTCSRTKAKNQARRSQFSSDRDCLCTVQCANIGRSVAQGRVIEALDTTLLPLHAACWHHSRAVQTCTHGVSDTSMRLQSAKLTGSQTKHCD